MSDPAPEPPAIEALAAFAHELHLVSVDPATNRARFYALTWRPTLFGERVLVRTWGRLGTGGRSRASLHADPARAQAEIAALLRRRLRHGYRVVAWR